MFDAFIYKIDTVA